MTRRETIKKTLMFEPPPRVPYNFDFTKKMRANLAAHFGTQDVDEAIGNYILSINIGSNAGAETNRVAEGLMKSIGHDTYQDEFGVVWDKSAGDDIGVTANQVLSDADLSLLKMPSSSDPLRWRGYEDVAAAAGDRYVLACFSSPLFQRAWFLRGLEFFLMDLAANEEFVNALLDKLMDFSIGIVHEVGRRKADGIFFYDDYAQQTGVLFSPDMFRTFFAPRLKKIFDVAKTYGLDVFLHSCGNVSAILEDIRMTGVNVFNPFQPEVMDIPQLAKTFSGRMAFYGGISTQKTLPYGTASDVRSEVRHRKALFADHGGYILAPAHAVQHDVPLENVLALIDEARK